MLVRSIVGRVLGVTGTCLLIVSITVALQQDAAACGIGCTSCPNTGSGANVVCDGGCSGGACRGSCGCKVNGTGLGCNCR